MTDDNGGNIRIARRGDWKTPPMPARHDSFVLKRAFIAWLMGVPEELMRENGYKEEWIEEQKPDAPPDEFCDLVKSSPQIKAILTGHNHATFVSQVTPTLKQYMVDPIEGRIFEIR